MYARALPISQVFTIFTEKKRKREDFHDELLPPNPPGVEPIGHEFERWLRTKQDIHTKHPKDDVNNATSSQNNQKASPNEYTISMVTSTRDESPASASPISEIHEPRSPRRQDFTEKDCRSSGSMSEMSNPAATARDETSGFATGRQKTAAMLKISLWALRDYAMGMKISEDGEMGTEATGVTGQSVDFWNIRPTTDGISVFSHGLIYSFIKGHLVLAHIFFMLWVAGLGLGLAFVHLPGMVGKSLLDSWACFDTVVSHDPILSVTVGRYSKKRILLPLFILSSHVPPMGPHQSIHVGPV
ncbi:hypothetical protein BKA67DRAFT_679437 [Truncatella angustata]|uniref:Uncharacterized protein n=1 Tax=Truncatella angustata TaxID=152316 RepID=A0A9P8UKE3_9PEZI|nr:uncharacterized protein BKA67DRAFT_679437 [Truncatella angustata]KAH6653600.1 hypothetical protein BKA67DRAFT_679437 [Truncatella angustata]